MLSIGIIYDFLIVLTIHCLSLSKTRSAWASGGGRPQNVGKCDKDTPVLRANTPIQFLRCSVRISQPPAPDARSREITPTR